MRLVLNDIKLLKRGLSYVFSRLVAYEIKVSAPVKLVSDSVVM